MGNSCINKNFKYKYKIKIKKGIKMNKDILERAKNIFKNQEFQILTGMKLESLEDKKSIIS